MMEDPDFCMIHSLLDRLLCVPQALQCMQKNAGVGKLLVTAALREHHRILDSSIKLEDWSRAEALFVQARFKRNSYLGPAPCCELALQKLIIAQAFFLRHWRFMVSTQHRRGIFRNSRYHM